MLLYSGLEVAELLDVGTDDLTLLVTVLLPDCEIPAPGDLREPDTDDVPPADLSVAVFVPEPPDQ